MSTPDQTVFAPPDGGVDPLISMVIDGRYTVLSRMARGGMASVYVAHDERLSRDVALKIMHPHLAESERFTNRFRQEARSAARISSPGVVPVYDQGVYHGQGYLVMELIDGPDLRSFVSAGPPLSLGSALAITEEVLRALAAAHRAGVVHRDLKPENVLVAPDKTLKLTDFGLARAVSEITMSSTGTIMGTVAYLAPEVALSGAADARTDIYAVGIMLFEMLTGKVPGGNAENPVQLALSRVQEDVAAPSEFEEWLPAEVDDLVLALAARQASDRPASANDAAALVARTLATLPAQILENPLPSPGVSTDPDATQAIQFPSKTSALPVGTNIVRTSGTVAPLSNQPSKKGKKTLIFTMILLLMVGMGLGFWWWWQEYGPGSYLEVPALAGDSLVDAEASLADLSLRSVVDFEHSDDVPTDHVIRTSPDAGSSVHKSEEVTLIVSSGILMVTVPPVEGLDTTEAQELITAAGLPLAASTESWSEDVAEGLVISSSPAGGESVDHRTEVVLTVSKGREPVAVPDLLGTEYDEASQMLTDLGFQVNRLEDYSDDYAIGTVSAMSPAAGTQLHRGDLVDLTYCLGSQYVQVPDVKGLSRSTAIERLQAAGLVVEVTQLAQFFDTVGSQSVAAGEWVHRGSTVVITVV